MSTRSAIVKSGDFSTLTATATMMRSNSRAPRRMMSTWPLVNGSNEPGYTASVDMLNRQMLDDGPRREVMNLIERQRRISRHDRA